MLEHPQILQTPQQRIALIHLVVERSKIREVMHEGLNELKAELAAQSIVASGPWFTHHRRIDAASFDFEICFPVDQEVTATGRVATGMRPSVRVAQAIYHGPYEGLGTAWGQLHHWITDKGLAKTPDLWERYLKGA
ncbi:MAG: AraC family transcriptional regulator [Deltaproteobacteria bacterium]|nr:MAG: AraC family transcriptional regulator [Deltaproteobacteria bacterium]